MKNKADQRLLRELNQRRARDGLSQAKIAIALGVTQGHLSKLLRGKVPLTVKMRLRGQSYLAGKPVRTSAIGDLEVAAIAAIRTSPAFRVLVQAALEMHKKA